ncbi:MAG: hypothetical protein Q7R83_04885 [bacterium]|nr:hypothetical protein [bacterium]
MKRSFAIFFALLIALPFFGFGCKKSAPTAQHNEYLNDISPLQNLSTRPPLVIETVQPQLKNATSSASPLDPQLEDIRLAINKLSKVNTFRATLSVPSPEGIVTGNVEFVRGVGLHGLLFMPGNIQSEVYLTDSQVFFRQDSKSAWSNLSGTPDGNEVAALFKTSFSLDNEKITIPEGAHIVGVGNDPSGCRLYIYTQPERTGRTQICIRDGLPTKLISQTELGNIELQYTDFNKTIPLSPPTTK